MKKYNKSEIMKRAWIIHRSWECTFRIALTTSWKEAKENLTKITAKDLEIGDIIEIQYGDYDNFMEVTVTSVEKKSVCYDFVNYKTYYIVKGIQGEGYEVEFCSELNQAVKIISKASQVTEVEEKKVEIVDYVKEYKKLQAMIEELQTKANAVKESIVEVMEAEQTEELQVDIFKVRYITVVSNRFNTTDFKKTHAELYNEYLKESTCKRFTVA